MAIQPNLTANQSAITEENQFEINMKWTYNILNYLQYFTGSVQLVIGILVIFADIFLIIVFWKNVKLRTKSNKYIFHYSMWHLVFVIFANTFFTFLKLTYLESRIPILLIYAVFEIDKLSLLFIYLFAMGLVIDWLFTVYNPDLQQKFNKVYNYLIFIIYAISFSYFLVQFILLLNSCWFSRHVINEIIYFALLLLLAIITYLEKNIEQNEKSCALNIASIIILFWLPLKMYRYLLHYSNGYYILHSVLVLTTWIPEWVYGSTSIVIVIMLGKWDKNFKVAFSTTFNRVKNNEKKKQNHEENKLYEIGDDEKVEDDLIFIQDTFYI